ncbi:snRNA-activating protein complex subunit 1b [Lampris incognitus]|uniref:snRNA-activating protein complex subunit 1b n=1 Tax=Lampris incognitus TaxID=2546036 RepID=UPI0024B4F735|nr:snRNA-activating protein complex subunit 1b [Lampris incognitus]
MESCKRQVKEDCEELLSRFQRTDSVRFEIFSRIWREMKFSDIFLGTQSDREKREFSRQIFATAYPFLMPPFTFQIRVGGLYLLYGLYHHQLSTPKEQISLALKDWEDLKKFERDAADAQHVDAVYILRHLFLQKAFYFSAMPIPLTYHVKRKPERKMMLEDFIEKASRPQELVSLDLMEELSNVHEEYKRLKAVISSAPDKLEPSLSLVKKDLVPMLRSVVLDFSKWQKQRDPPIVKDEDSGEGTSTQIECSRRSELLASIKSRSYGQAIEVSRSRRHRVVEMELISNDTNMATQRKKHESLKERTFKNVKIRGEMVSETLKTTKIWQISNPVTEQEDSPEKDRTFK